MPRHFIDEIDDTLVFERSESFGGGMDGFLRAALLAPDQWQYGENLILADNLEAGTRAGVTTLGSSLGAAIQGLLFFSTPSITHLVAASSGKLFYRGPVGAWTETTGYTPADPTIPIAAAQGMDQALFSDASGALAIWNGTAWSICTTGATDPPTGPTCLCWHGGRMFAGGFSGSGGAGKEDDAIWVSNRLSFGNGQWDQTTRQFRVGAGEGDPIRAIASMQAFNLAVLKENSVWIVNADPAYEAADFSADQPSESVSYGVGCVGRRAWCNYGNDLLFLARDGVRSLQRMVAAAGQYQLAAPISQPIQPLIDRINWAYASKVAAVKYRELALFAVPLDNALTPNTVLVWHGRLGRWIGIWTGLTPTAWAVTRYAGVSELIHGDASGRVRMWKDGDDPEADATYLDDATGIASKLWTRSMLFGEPINYKTAYHAEVRLSAANALMNITLMGDDAELKTWSVNAQPTGAGLPLNLPFDLATTQPAAERRGLRGLLPFNEVYLRLESTSGWWRARNFTLSAFLNTLANQ